ncbi:hypothetical protein MYX07_04055, partial [Patescibacteria group bacterium AH-259-L07]|nr:hypothetical protein [Patescibacteria group bacterium AH-259-L07]
MNNAQQGRIKSCQLPTQRVGRHRFLIAGVFLFIFLLVTGYGLLVTAPVGAFTPPSAAPPGDNVPRPFNIGPTAQYKLGKVGIGTASAVAGTPLDVFGDGSATGNITGAKYWDYDDSTLTYYLDPASTDWGLYTAGSINAFGTTKANYFAGKIGIATATPVVTLDMRGTDAIQIPAGISTERPGSPAAGMFRYNTTTGSFEGYTNIWGAIGGGGVGGGVEWRQEYIATANQTVFDITAGTYSTGNNEILVFYNGVLQQTGSGNDYVETDFDTITFNTPRATGKTIVIIKGSVSGGSAGGWSDDGDVVRLTTIENTVGVGTATPQEKLDLRGRLYIGDTTAPSITTNRLYSEAGTLKWGDTVVTTGSGGSWLPSGNDIYYNTGNVGIGVTNPETLLHLRSSAATELRLTSEADTILRFGDAADTDRVYINYANPVDKLFISALNTRGADITIDGATGNVGIGVTSPTETLDVRSSNQEIAEFSGSTASNFIMVSTQTEATNQESGIGFGVPPLGGVLGSDRNTAFIVSDVTQATPSTLKGNLQFHINTGDQTAEAMRIDDTGNVGIGTTVPTKPLHIASSAGGHDVNLIATDSEASMRFENDARAFAVGTRDLGVGLDSFFVHD